MQSVLARLADLPPYAIYVLRNPAINPKAAFIVYGTIGVSLLIVLVAGIVFMMRAPKGDKVSRERSPAADSSTVRPGALRSRRERAPHTRMTPRARIAAAVVAILLVGVSWAATGSTTSESAVCKDCHWPAATHATAVAGTDVHASVSCVSCHETGGIVGRYLTGVPARLMHFADSQASTPRQGEYGRVKVAACSACHEASLKGVATNEARGIKISHSEPLAASATCLDCHAMRAGVVGPHNVGMAPCLRCHDAEHASVKCVTCHDESAGSAARARTTSFAAAQIVDVSCGGCHNEKRDCDGCHGMRLPHTTEFKMYAHARAGAVDFWYNGGKACSRCHTSARRPCQKCHAELLGREHGAGASWLARGHQKATAQACDTCHREFAYTATRDFCKDLCHTPAAIEASPR
jgi:hypothetical protein